MTTDAYRNVYASEIGNLVDDMVAPIVSKTYMALQKAAEKKMVHEGKTDINDVQLDNPKNFKFNLDFNERFKVELVSCGNYEQYLSPEDITEINNLA